MTDGFVDQEALRLVIEKAEDALRPLGLTVQMEMTNVSIMGTEILVVLPCLLRPEAKEKLEGDKESRAEFNKMMAERNEALVEEKRKEIAAAMGDLDGVLFGGTDTCKHGHVHPDGFCIDCGEPVGQ